MKQTGCGCFDKPSCSKQRPCGVCSVCYEHKNKTTTIEDDGEITLYETSLGYEPFKE